MVDSSVGSAPEAGSKFEAAVGPDFALLAGFALGMQANSAHFVIGEFVLPIIL